MRHLIVVAAAILAAVVIGGWKWTSGANATSDYPVPVIVDSSNQLQEVGANPDDAVVDGWSWGD
jgi:hypothetical protein